MVELLMPKINKDLAKIIKNIDAKIITEEDMTKDVTALFNKVEEIKNS